jgi:hypothetical protein
MIYHIIIGELFFLIAIKADIHLTVITWSIHDYIIKRGPDAY